MVTQLAGGDNSVDRRGVMVLQPVRKDPLNLPATSETASAPVR